MKIVFFGLSISSAWGNGHATLLRGLFRCLHSGGHEIDFFERDAPYYASHRDAASFPYVSLHLYSEWKDIESRARAVLKQADLAVITSYCADAETASRLIFEASGAKTVFYDMDTPVTLERVQRGEEVAYLPSSGLGAFDLVLSYTGGEALRKLSTMLGARNTAPMYGWVDPDTYYPGAFNERFASDLSYLGTYSEDRQAALNDLLIAPAARLSAKTFLVAGALYPESTRWPQNVRHLEHVAPPNHRDFYCSSSMTLNVTRGSMAKMGYCPSGRLFEAAACGTAVLSDWWEGLDTFFTPGEEILLASATGEACAALSVDAHELKKIAQRARQRTLDCHTARHRAAEFLRLIEHNEEEHANVGNHSGGGYGYPHSTAGVLEGTLTHRQ